MTQEPGCPKASESITNIEVGSTDEARIVRVLVQCVDKAGRLVAYVFISNRNIDTLVGLPGGGVEDGENILDAAIREVLEETGIQLHPDNVFIYSDWFEISKRVGRETIHKHLCVATVPLSQALEQRYNLEFNPGRTKPPGNDGEVARIAQVSEIPHLMSRGAYVEKHLDYIRHKKRAWTAFIQTRLIRQPVRSR